MPKYITKKISKPFRSGDPIPWRPERIEQLVLRELVPDPGNARKHSAKQIGALANGIAAFGWSTPILIDENNRILAGHARLAAAQRLGIEYAPCIRLTHLTLSQKKALSIADNAITDASSWDDAALRAVLAELDDVHFDLSLTGLDPGVIDFHLDGPAGGAEADPADAIPAIDPNEAAISRPGDRWLLDRHVLYCGDALQAECFEVLLGGEQAALVITDPPYDVPIRGHVSGLGRHQHREFVMASGEMGPEAFSAFLGTATGHLARFSVEGSIHYLFMDWRHIAALIQAASPHYGDFKNVCVWVKSNAGMGALYRSQHELVAVFKKGSKPHTNNVELGRHGRNRSNVWEYAGANAFGATRDADLAAHPTVKPIAMIADAIRDCSKRGELVLDPFAGSGTTILACERSGRRAAVMEIDPLYVDLAVRRWETLTGKTAVLEGDGRSFKALEGGRRLLALEDHSADEEAGR